MAKEKIVYEGTPVGNWMVTFSDMNTLLLTFFVLLFSMSTIATDRFDEIFQNNKGDGLGLMSDEGTSYSSSIIIDPMPILQESARVSLLRSFNTSDDLLNESVGLPNGVEINFSGDLNGQITITLADRILFEPGESSLDPRHEELMNNLRLFIQKVIAISPRRIVIEGHSDNRTTEAERLTISAERAMAVLEEMLKDNVLPPSLFSIVGYGDAKPIVPNNSDANRARNRRVRVVLEAPEDDISSEVEF